MPCASAGSVYARAGAAADPRPLPPVAAEAAEAHRHSAERTARRRARESAATGSIPIGNPFFKNER
jgi:hypothetical protein